MGKENTLFGTTALAPGKWHFVAATCDGEECRIYSDGVQLASGKLDSGSVSPVLQMAPPFLPSPNWRHFGGSIASVTVVRSALGSDEIKRLFEKPDNFSTIAFEEGSKPWPVETRAQAGYRAPQDPATMPRSKAPYSRPVATALLTAQPALQSEGKDQWSLTGGWRMTPAPRVSADGAAISQSGYRAQEWWQATVPGTVLTTMIDRGVYPDP